MNWKLSKQKRFRLILIGVILICIMVAAVFFYKTYKITDVRVEGSSHYTADEIKEMVLTDRLCENSVFLSLKYRNKSIRDIPFIERMDVSIEDNHTVLISVYEKTLAGYVQYLGNYMYFDKDGIIVESSKVYTPGVVEVTGLQFDHVVLHEKLPVEDGEIFQRILNITQLLNKNEIVADRIYFNFQDEMTIYFGDVRVNLGEESTLTEKVMQLKYILPSLEGKSGVLHMENFSETNKNSKFEEDEPEEDELTQEEETGGEEE